MSPKCKCGGLLMPECFQGMPLYREVGKGFRAYKTKCMACGGMTEITRKGCFPALQGSPFQVGRRWRCEHEANRGRARFWFIIVGDGHNYAGKLSTVYKRGSPG